MQIVICSLLCWLSSGPYNADCHLVLIMQTVICSLLCGLSSGPYNADCHLVLIMQTSICSSLCWLSSGPYNAYCHLVLIMQTIICSSLFWLSSVPYYADCHLVSGAADADLHLDLMDMCTYNANIEKNLFADKKTCLFFLLSKVKILGHVPCNIRHVIIYQAMDAAGNRERCVFSIR